jgi:hypothetical protein
MIKVVLHDGHVAIFAAKKLTGRLSPQLGQLFVSIEVLCMIRLMVSRKPEGYLF